MAKKASEKETPTDPAAETDAKESIGLPDHDAAEGPVARAGPASAEPIEPAAAEEDDGRGEGPNLNTRVAVNSPPYCDDCYAERGEIVKMERYKSSAYATHYRCEFCGREDQRTRPTLKDMLQSPRQSPQFRRP